MKLKNSRLEIIIIRYLNWQCLLINKNKKIGCYYFLPVSMDDIIPGSRRLVKEHQQGLVDDSITLF